MVAALVVASVVLAAGVVAAVMVTAVGVGSKLVAAVVVFEDASTSMAQLSTAAMSLIDVNGMSVVGYGCDGNIWHSHQCAERDEWYRMVVVFPSECTGGGALYIPGGVLVPDSSCSSLDVVPKYPSMLLSNPFTTSWPLPHRVLNLYSVVCHILLVIPVLGGELSAHFCNFGCVSCLEVTRG